VRPLAFLRIELVARTGWPPPSAPAPGPRPCDGPYGAMVLYRLLHNTRQIRLAATDTVGFSVDCDAPGPFRLGDVEQVMLDSAFPFSVLAGAD